jgi:transcriptional regulator with XRE-family HTH domain
MWDYHIGEAIRQKVEEQKMSIPDFADALHCSRRNVYHIFKRKVIDEDLLKKMSTILKCDFTLLSHESNKGNQKHLIIIEADKWQLHEIMSKYTVLYSYNP